MSTPPTLIFASFLATNLFKTYQHITAYLEKAVGHPICLICGETLDDFAEGVIDAGFICGISYVELTTRRPNPVKLLAAPVLSGPRYASRPIYFSDVVVRADSPFYSFDDLADSLWAYNEKSSHSGYNLVRYTLLEKGITTKYFRQTIETGSHMGSLRLVLQGRADAAALDSHMLDVVLQENPIIRSQLRVIGSLGPSTIPPVVTANHLDPQLRQRLQNALLTMHRDPIMAEHLRAGAIDQFLPVSDEHYDDIRMMRDRVRLEAAGMEREGVALPL